MYVLSVYLMRGVDTEIKVSSVMLDDNRVVFKSESKIVVLLIQSECAFFFFLKWFVGVSTSSRCAIAFPPDM